MSGTNFMASSIYGTAPVVIPGVTPQTAMSATDDAANGSWRDMLNPNNPLVWFGVLLLVTAGAAAVSGSVKLGPAKVTAAVGNSGGS